MKGKNILRVLLAVMILAHIGFGALWIYIFGTQWQNDGVSMTTTMVEQMRLRGTLRSICEALIYITFIAYSWLSRYIYKIKEIKSFVELMKKLITIVGILGLLEMGVNYIILSEFKGVFNFLEPMLVCLGISVVNIAIWYAIKNKSKCNS